MKNPTDIYYSTQHLWVSPQDDGAWLAGITDYAQDLLGDIVYVEAPAIDTALTAGTPCGLVESVKTGSDLHAPLDGIVTAINEALQSTPELINDKPYQAWIFKFKPSDPEHLKNLLSAAEYEKTLSA